MSARPRQKKLYDQVLGFKHAVILKKPIAQVLVPRQGPHERWHVYFIWTWVREHDAQQCHDARHITNTQIYNLSGCVSTRNTNNPEIINSRNVSPQAHHQPTNLSLFECVPTNNIVNPYNYTLSETLNHK